MECESKLSFSCEVSVVLSHGGFVFGKFIRIRTDDLEYFVDSNHKTAF